MRYQAALVNASRLRPHQESNNPPMTTHEIDPTVNGTAHQPSVEPRALLVHALRDEPGETGTTVGCESSLPGAVEAD